MLPLLLALVTSSFGVGARVQRSLHAEARVERGLVRVRAPREAAVSVRREEGRVVVTVQR